ncbi:hypothetical protein BU198_32440, partial [Streptomyces sp. CBMA156]|nr:hypothetical protein [Streptomyces sp. CBMA156]
RVGLGRPMRLDVRAARGTAGVVGEDEGVVPGPATGRRAAGAAGGGTVRLPVLLGAEVTEDRGEEARSGELDGGGSVGLAVC